MIQVVPESERCTVQSIVDNLRSNMSSEMIPTTVEEPMRELKFEDGSKVPSDYQNKCVLTVSRMQSASAPAPTVTEPVTTVETDHDEDQESSEV